MKTVLHQSLLVFISFVWGCSSLNVSSDHPENLHSLMSQDFDILFLDKTSPNLLREPYRSTLSEFHLEEYQGLSKVFYLIPKNTQEIKLHKIMDFIKTLNVDVVAPTSYQGNPAVVGYNLKRSPLPEEDLQGTWARDPHNDAGYYPGSFRFLPNKRYEYRSHAMDIYQKYFAGSYIYTPNTALIRKEQDLWPQGLWRAQDQKSEERNYYTVNKNQEHVYSFYVLNSNDQGRVIDFLVEYSFRHSSIDQDFYTHAIFSLVSEDPYYELKYRIDPLNQ